MADPTATHHVLGTEHAAALSRARRRHLRRLRRALAGELLLIAGVAFAGGVAAGTYLVERPR